MAAKVWFKMVNPESDWEKVSLEGIIDVADIRAEIRNKMSRTLNSYDAANLTISATKGEEDARNAEKLDARDTLESILSRFGIEGHPTIPEAFARNVWLFVSVPTAPEPHGPTNRPQEWNLGSRKRRRSDGSPGPGHSNKRDRISIDSANKNRELFRLIKEKSPSDPKSYADPAQHHKLPFPFLWRDLPRDRFELSGGEFGYMGREQFEELWSKVEVLGKDPHPSKLFLCGTVGFGKSHLLTCLALLLIQRDEAVVYLPDCRALLRSPVPYLQAAMLLTFAGNVDTQEKVQQLRSMEDVAEFFVYSCPKDVVFVIDQWNSFEPEKDISRDNVSNEQKSRTQQLLNTISANYRCIRSASANYLTFRYMEQKQRSETTIYVHGGLTKTEMETWWERNKNFALGGHSKIEIEDVTGRVPLLLNSVFRNGGTADLTAPELEDVSFQVQLFVEEKWNELERSPRKWSRYVDYMNECILNREVSVIEPGLCDHRYFHCTREADGRMQGFSTCGVARNSMAKILRRYSSIKASEYSFWLWNLPSVITNPPVTGFLIENACLSCIALNGLHIGLNLKGGMVEKAFSGRRPEYSWEDKRVIYCPISFNFPAIDALIVLRENLKNRKKVFFFPVQVTIAKEHKNSEPQFFVNWAEWFRDLEDVELEIHFLWITHDECHLSKAVNKDSLEGRDGEEIIHPSYTSHRVPISSVSTHISERLQAARGQAPTEVEARVDKWPGGYTAVGNSGSSSTGKPAREKKTRPPSKTHTIAGPEGQSGGPSVAGGSAAGKKRNAPAAKGKAPATRKSK